MAEIWPTSINTIIKKKNAQSRTITPVVLTLCEPADHTHAQTGLVQINHGKFYHSPNLLLRSAETQGKFGEK